MVARSTNIYNELGSGCGSVGRAVAPQTRDPQFESSHWTFLFTVLKTVLKKRKEKRGWELYT